MKIEATTKHLKFGLDFNHWGRAFVARRVTSWVAALGPAYLVRRGLPFDRAAASDTANALSCGPIGRISKMRNLRN